jgi:hypothetical protein
MHVWGGVVAPGILVKVTAPTELVWTLSILQSLKRETYTTELHVRQCFHCRKRL